MSTTTNELASNFTKNLPQKWHKVSCPRNVCSDFTFVHNHNNARSYMNTQPNHFTPAAYPRAE